MAKMSAMALEIEERLATGATHNEIAEALEVSVEWVEAVAVMVSETIQ
jgi:DNA-binding CsgD family transcriptional regulator